MQDILERVKITCSLMHIPAHQGRRTNPCAIDAESCQLQIAVLAVDSSSRGEACAVMQCSLVAFKSRSDRC